MTELVKFKNEEFGEIRTMEIDNEIWFLGKEVALMLGYNNERDALKRHVDDEDKKTLKFKDCRESLQSNLWVKGDYTNKTLINESGVYALIFGSKLESAKRFKKWVTSEVLPSIRKTGAYGGIKTDEDKKKELAYQLLIGGIDSVEAHKQLLELETKPLKDTIELQKPKVKSYDNFIDKEHTLGFREMRKELESASGKRIKEPELKEILRELKIINKSNIKATAYAIRKGYAVTKDVEMNMGTKTQDRFTMSARELVLEYFLYNYNDEDEI